MTEKEFALQWHNSDDFIEAKTSGSTGHPKTIKLSKNDMLLSAKATNSYFGIDSSSRLICPMDYRYIGAKMMYVRAQAASAELVSIMPSNIFSFSGYADLLAVVPSQVDNILITPKLRKRIRNLIIGGAPLDSRRAQKLQLTEINAFTTYGMTETASHVALAPVGSKYYRSLPLINFDIDNRGCLIINMPGRDLSQVITNDIVTLSNLTTFQWIGRHDNVINSGGIKIHPEQLSLIIKETLSELSLPYKEVMVYGVVSEKWGEEAHCAIENERNYSPKEFEAVQLRLETKLGNRNYLPRKYHIVSRLERTPNGTLKLR